MALSGKILIIHLPTYILTFVSFLDALASLELVMIVGYTFFREIFNHGVTRKKPLNTWTSNK